MERPATAGPSVRHPGNPTIKLPNTTVQQPSHLHPTTPVRNGQISVDTFSPVNENGSFAFDRVLKTGKVHRRIKHKHVSQSTMVWAAFDTF